jgi:hypothetical protein
MSGLKQWATLVLPRLLVVAGVAASLLPAGDYFLRTLALMVVPVALWTLALRLVGIRALSLSLRSNAISLGLLVAAIFLHIAVSSYFSCWCCIRERDIASMCEVLVATLEKLNSNGVHAW